MANSNSCLPTIWPEELCHQQRQKRKTEEKLRKSTPTSQMFAWLLVALLVAGKCNSAKLQSPTWLFCAPGKCILVIIKL